MAPVGVQVQVMDLEKVLDLEQVLAVDLVLLAGLGFQDQVRRQVLERDQESVVVR